MTMEITFLRKPIFKSLLTMIIAILTTIGAAWMLMPLVQSQLNKVVSAESTFIMWLDIGELILPVVFLIGFAILCLYYINNFKNHLQLLNGQIILLDNNIEIHGRTKKALIPEMSIVRLIKIEYPPMKMRIPGLKENPRTLLLTWRGEDRTMRFPVRENLIGEKAFKEIVSILGKREGYVDDQNSIRPILKELKLNNITISRLLGKWYDLQDGVAKD